MFGCWKIFFWENTKNCCCCCCCSGLFKLSYSSINNHLHIYYNNYNNINNKQRCDNLFLSIFISLFIVLSIILFTWWLRLFGTIFFLSLHLCIECEDMEIRMAPFFIRMKCKIKKCSCLIWIFFFILIQGMREWYLIICMIYICTLWMMKYIGYLVCIYFYHVKIFVFKIFLIPIFFLLSQLYIDADIERYSHPEIQHYKPMFFDANRLKLFVGARYVLCVILHYHFIIMNYCSITKHVCIHILYSSQQLQCE